MTEWPGYARERSIRTRSQQARGCARRGHLMVLLAAALSILASVMTGAIRAGASPRLGLVSPNPASPVSLRHPGIDVTPGQGIPDPYVIEVHHLYYMFSSQELFFGPNVPVRTSHTLVHWPSKPSEAMPVLPSWAEAGSTWSPDVRYVDGRFVMWFNADVAGTGYDGLKCIGVATAAHILGPYRSSATRPAVCQRRHLGSIDPRTFRSPDGRLWLLWKSDDNSDVKGSAHSSIYIQRLAPNGLSLLGRPTRLLTADMPWEGRIVEAPDMVFAKGKYWLFFSGNWFNQPAYALGLALCRGPRGPCEPATVGPWLSSNAQGSGPGEGSLFHDGARWWLFYAPFAVHYQAFTPRPVVMARVAFGPHGPRVVPPARPGRLVRKHWHGTTMSSPPCRTFLMTCRAQRADEWAREDLIGGPPTDVGLSGLGDFSSHRD